MGTTSNRSWPYPESTDFVADGATAIENLADAIDGSIGRGYAYVQTVYFASSGSFTKASYPWLRALRVTVIGAGGGSGAVPATAAGQSGIAGSGGGGGAGLRLVTNIAGLAASETITIGAGGTAGTGGGGGGTGGTSSAFGVSAGGGEGGEAGAASANNTSRGTSLNGSPSGTFDLRYGGSVAQPSLVINPGASLGATSGAPGSAFTGGVYGPARDNSNAVAGSVRGEGSRAGCSRQSLAAKNGAAGAAGLVIVELYA
jgi:hypothetical protein